MIAKIKRWLRRARKRLWGAKHYREETRKKIEATKRALDKADHAPRREELQKRLKELRRVEAKLTHQVKHRREVRDHLAKKLKHQKNKKEHDGGSGGGSGNCGFSTPSRGWNPYGRQIPNWMIPWLDKSVQAGWDGVVVSGVRTPAYSQQLCYNMCGAPTCSGTCAGLGSNHNMSAGECYPEGALDLNDQYEFEQIQFQIGSPFRNYLPADTVHFSVSGK